jgi:hypothetical protein
MPKKSRTPPPPRRVQSPQPRRDERSADDRRRLLILAGVAASGFVGLGVALALFAFGGGSGSGDASQAMRDAGCTLQTIPVRYPGGDPSNRHFEQLPKGYKYPSFPPAGGPHNPSPAPFDVYDEPVAQPILVHNLEHGAIVIEYGNKVPEAEIPKLLDWYRDDPNGIVIVPLPALGDKISLAAWNADLSATGQVNSERSYLAKCTHFDKNAFSAFRNAYRFKGPERFKPEDLAPGN